MWVSSGHCSRPARAVSQPSYFPHGNQIKTRFASQRVRSLGSKTMVSASCNFGWAGLSCCKANASWTTCGSLPTWDLTTAGSNTPEVASSDTIAAHYHDTSSDAENAVKSCQDRLGAVATLSKHVGGSQRGHPAFQGRYPGRHDGLALRELCNGKVGEGWFARRRMRDGGRASNLLRFGPSRLEGQLLGVDGAKITSQPASQPARNSARMMVQASAGVEISRTQCKWFAARER
ncbi:hypothetical protein B0H63DRAFT_244284 [Podospora didyma]|uniref:Uncharacterized protein n=1 Tax=Podospora didyma TaxID=330526 RepID=A0AAE0NCF5_9PEZI|nr:hypothetical protein B0H63DRAFT_244284 [Podospora didyma]